METSASFEARSAPSSYPTASQSGSCAALQRALGLRNPAPSSFAALSRSRFVRRHAVDFGWLFQPVHLVLHITKWAILPVAFCLTRNVVSRVETDIGIESNLIQPNGGPSTCL